MTRPPDEYQGYGESGGQESFSELAGLLLPSVSTVALLELVVNLAVGAVAGVDGASVSLVHHDGDRFETSNASSPELIAVDEAQYDRAEGPCVHAIRTTGDVTVEIPVPRWPEFSDLAQRTGVRSVSSLPLQPEDRTLGALNLYSFTEPALSPEALQVARSLAAQAAVVLANASALTLAELINRQLREALETRDLIGQAKGIIMAREHVGADQAFDIMRRASQRTNTKLRDIAAGIVEHLGEHGGAP